MALDVHPTASGAELQSHRRILALGLTERYNLVIQLQIIFYLVTKSNKLAAKYNLVMIYENN